MKEYTALILPAFSEQAGRLTIVCKEGTGFGLSDYRRNPDHWYEIGKVSAQSGEIVCLDGPQSLWEAFRDMEPLRPPLTETFMFAYPER